MTEEKQPKTEMVPIVSIVGGEVHLQNIILDKSCHICHKAADDSMLLLRVSDKGLVYSCPQHKGIVQEFVRQFKRAPLGWEVLDAPKSNSKDKTGISDSV